LVIKTLKDGGTFVKEAYKAPHPCGSTSSPRLGVWWLH